MKEKRKETIFDILGKTNPKASQGMKEHQEIPIMKIAALDNLPRKVSFTLDKDLYSLISLILKRIEGCAYDGIGNDEPIPFVISPYFYFNDETYKFLVHLLCKKIISNLYLPVFLLREKSIIHTRFSHAFPIYKKENEEEWKYVESVFKDALYETAKFKENCTSFNLLKRKAFISIAKRIIKQNKLEKQKGVINLELTKRIPKISFEDGRLRWNDKEAVFERGQGKVLDIFLKNSRVYYGEYLSRKGEEINTEVFKKEGGYAEKTFRDALKNIRSKLNGFPMKIINEKTHHYILEIKYSSSIGSK